MKKRRTLFTISILVLLLFITTLIVQSTIQDDDTITLPEHITEAETGDNAQTPDNLNVLSITPDTVQAAIATLSRPVSYHRTQSIELFWSNGSSVTTLQVAVNGSLMRIDSVLSDGTVCHTLSNKDSCAVWYDEDRTWVTMRADQYSADVLQRIPTYETVLDLPVERIIQADYRLLGDVYCIYVLTGEDEEGYADSYFISVQSGLLYFAERTHNGQLIYRFNAGEPDGSTPEGSLFLLPDGSTFAP